MAKKPIPSNPLERLRSSAADVREAIKKPTARAPKAKRKPALEPGKVERRAKVAPLLVYLRPDEKRALMKAANEASEKAGKRVTQSSIIRRALRKVLGLPARKYL